MECYICHRLVKRHEYTRHVGSHLAADVTEMPRRPDPTAFTGSDTGFPVQPTPPQAPRRQPPELDAFQTWLENYTPAAPKYTTIDGQKRYSDLEVFRRAAEVMRCTTRQEVIDIVNEFEPLRGSLDEQECLDLIRRTPIFPGLVAYTYTHLVRCHSGRGGWSDHVSELKQSVDRWEKCGDEWCILSCHLIKEELLSTLRSTKVGSEEHKCNLKLMNGVVMLNNDILNLAALVAARASGKFETKNLGQPGSHKRFIELLNDLLESGVELKEPYRRSIMNVLIPLSNKSGYCPRGMHIPKEKIKGCEWVNGGGFGSVYKGTLGSRAVALKALKQPAGSPDYKRQIAREAMSWRYLRHPNCLPLYGIFEMDTGEISLVSPWMDRGTLSTYLKGNPEADRPKLILDVVKGLTYMHTMKPHVAHRDIKPDNILVTRGGRACLSDFGLASFFDTMEAPHTAASQVGIAGTPFFVAPEMSLATTRKDRHRINKRACDMYALGCTIYAAYTGKPPFANNRYHAYIESDRRPAFPANDDIPRDMQSFVENLCSQDPSKRLTAQMALDWMKVKVKVSHDESLDSSLGPSYEEEWMFERQPDDQNLWSVFI